MTTTTLDFDPASVMAPTGHVIVGRRVNAGEDGIEVVRPCDALAAATVWINRYRRASNFIVPTDGFKGYGPGKGLGRQAVEANLRYKRVLMDVDGA